MSARKVDGMTWLEHLEAWLMSSNYASSLRRKGDHAAAARWEARARAHEEAAASIKPLPRQKPESERAS